MGVIKRSKFQHVSPLETGADVVDVEALQQLEYQSPLPEQDPQVPSTPSTTQRNGSSPRSQWSRKPDAEEKYPKGQKKKRRYENNKFLLNLAKGEERTYSVMGETKSAFATLFQQKDKMAAWNAFLSFSEDEQQAIIANNEILAFFNNEAVLDEAVVEKISNFRDVRRKMSPEEAFNSLCPKLKSIFGKRHFPMGILIQLESQILDFFLESPRGTCIIERQCSFDRLIVHAISQFNVLFSQSFSVEGNRRETRVRNMCPEFLPPPVSLSELIAKKRY